jgi:hypothetical protein
MASNELTGRCPCGAVRFVIGAVFDARYCHCEDCRRASGAPVSAAAVVRPTDFRIDAGETRADPAPNGVRHRCGACDAEVYYAFATTSGDFVSVPIGFLDDPDACPPRVHQWFARRVRWLHVHDQLPKYATGRLPHPARRG